MACELKRVLRKGLCANDLNSKVTIFLRKLRSSNVGNIGANVSTLEKLDDFMCGIETINPVTRQFLKGVEDTVSHLFYFQFSERISRLEKNRAFIEFRGEYYRLKGSLNHNEQNRFLVLFCEYRGSKEEVEAKA